jgi:hypothetical protein
VENPQLPCKRQLSGRGRGVTDEKMELYPKKKESPNL